MKAKQCDECNLWERLPCEFRCNAGHKPRFYLPKSPIDSDFGWKRVCADFSKKRV
jgi:hypothetical protein